MFLNKIKNHPVVRGIYFFRKSYFSNLRRRKYGLIDSSVIISPPIWGNLKNVFIDKNVGIGPNAFFSATNAKVIIRGNCSIAENLTVHTGNHARLIGKFVSEINDSIKPKGYDKDVIIEKDVWIGCNVTILSGVTIGRGATIAAGAVVNKDIPPYCIAGGIPAKPIKFYWSIDDVLEHEKQLYSANDRMSREELEAIYRRNEE